MDERIERNTLSVILGGGRGTRLYPLTRQRAKPAVPLGGKYRLIDVPISNCLNSGLNKIFVLTQFESNSLNQHIQGSYRFDRFGGGFVEVLPAELREDAGGWYQGSADAVRQCMVHFHGEYDEVLILCGDQLYHMDFQTMIGNHRRTQADMSIAVLPVDAETATACGIMQVTDEGRVVGFVEKPSLDELPGLETNPELFNVFGIEAEGRPYLASMGIYLFNQQVLNDELTENQYVDFGKNMFPAVIGGNTHKVQAFPFDGYWEDVGTVQAFHEANLSMAKFPPAFSFRSSLGMIYTRPRNLPSSNAEHLQASESIIADGCRIGSLDCEQTILGIRSIIGRDVNLRRTYVMGADYYESEAELAVNRRDGLPDVGIGDRCVIEDAIVDKNARIGHDVIIKNPDRIEPKETPTYLVRDGVICILKEAIIQSGTRVGVD